MKVKNIIEAIKSGELKEDDELLLWSYDHEFGSRYFIINPCCGRKLKGNLLLYMGPEITSEHLLNQSR